MQLVTGIFSLMVAAFGWYYMFYSRGATNLSGIERQDINRKRHRLRQVGGLVMMLLAIGMYAGFNSVDPQVSPSPFVMIWLGVFVLLLITVILAMIDLRLTWKLRQRRRVADHDVESESESVRDVPH
jgi:drug/metabolite transporter (DMT)-like permease